MKYRRIHINPNALIQLMQERDDNSYVKLVSGLPKNTAFIGFHYEEETNRFIMIVSNDSFDDIPEGGVLPLLDPAFKVIREEEL
jgi:hypothetical protein